MPIYSGNHWRTPVRKTYSTATIVAAASALALVGAANAGVISYVRVTNDADSGISSANTYTHAIDFEQTPTGTTINGVVFTGMNNAYGPGFTRTLANGGSSHNNGAGVVSTTGNLANLMQGFLYNNGPATDGTGLQTYTISGLTPGTTYDLRVYTHLWTNPGNRPNTLVFDSTGAADSTGLINQDNATSFGMPGVTDSAYINYRYTATGTSLSFTAANAAGSNASWHLYGLSNQVVPEPGSLALLGLGGLLVGYRRRRA